MGWGGGCDVILHHAFRELEWVNAIQPVQPAVFFKL
jgi:hypothetical protein